MERNNRQMRIILASASPRRKELLEQIGLHFEVVTSCVEERVSSVRPDKVVEELSCQKAEAVGEMLCREMDGSDKEQFSQMMDAASEEQSCQGTDASGEKQCCKKTDASDEKQSCQKMNVAGEGQSCQKMDAADEKKPCQGKNAADEELPCQGTDAASEKQFCQKMDAASEGQICPGVDVTKEALLIIGADTVVALDGAILGKPLDGEEAFKMLEHLQGREHQVYTGVTLLYRPVGAAEWIRKCFHEQTRVHFYPMTEKEIAEYVSTGDPLDKAGAYGIQGFCARYVRKIEGDYNNVVGLPVGRLYQEIKEWLQA